MLEILVGLVAGMTMSVAVSCVWAVLLLPARVQDVLQAGSPRLFGYAFLIGMVATALGNGTGFTLRLPQALGSAGLLLGGAFVGMLASALSEILEVVPVLLRRCRITDESKGVRWVMLIGKVLGAVLGCLLYPL